MELKRVSHHEERLNRDLPKRRVQLLEPSFWVRDCVS